MTWSRRDFLRTGSAFAAAGVIGLDGRLLSDPYAAARAYRPFRPLLQDPDVRAIAMTALQAMMLGAREPDVGRYDVVLGSSAVSSIFNATIVRALEYDRMLGYEMHAGGTKVGLQVFDERLSFVSDPMDPEAPFCPFSGTGVPFDRTYWVQDGILRNLSFGDATAIERGLEYPLANPISVRIQPRDGMPLLTLEEMIETCERGIYVTRLTMGIADFRRLVFTGVTRDGTWLVERGRITRPVANMRYVDSHMYFLNNLEAVGEPVLAASGGVMLPPVRARDFDFTAIADAV